MSIYLTDKLRLVTNGVFRHWCPGCLTTHDIEIFNENCRCRNFNGSIDYPTFRPSVKIVVENQMVCHYNLVEGVIHYFGDSKHSLDWTNILLPVIPQESF